jgi:deoxyribose-phosphate aldolase
MKLSKMSPLVGLAAAKAGAFDAVEADIAAVRAAVPSPTVLKVIIQAAALTDDEIVAVTAALHGSTSY